MWIIYHFPIINGGFNKVFYDIFKFVPQKKRNFKYTDQFLNKNIAQITITSQDMQNCYK